jgi:hypothetical protein
MYYEWADLLLELTKQLINSWPSADFWTLVFVSLCPVYLLLAVHRLLRSAYLKISLSYMGHERSRHLGKCLCHWGNQELNILLLFHGRYHGLRRSLLTLSFAALENKWYR